MERLESDEWVRNHDMPHEHIMDEYDVEYDELSESIQTDIRRFDRVYDEALKDGFIDDEEENEIIAESYKISVRIKEEHLGEDPNGNNSGGMFGGILAGIGIAALTIFGINQIREK